MSGDIIPRHRPSLEQLRADLALIRAYRTEAQDELDAGKLHFGPTLDRLIAEEDRLMGEIFVASADGRRETTRTALHARGIG